MTIQGQNYRDEKIFWDNVDTGKGCFQREYELFLLSTMRRFYGLSPEGQMVLEVGSGGNRTLDGKGCFCVCADYSYKVLRDAHGIYTVPVCCDASNLPFKDNAFEIVISNNVLHHLKHEGIFSESVEEIYRVTAGGGRFYLTDRNPESGILVRIYSSIIMGTKRILHLFLQGSHHGSLNEPMLDKDDYMQISRRFQIETRINWFNLATSTFYNVSVGLVSVLGERIVTKNLQSGLMKLLVWIENSRLFRKTNLVSSFILKPRK